MDIPKELVPLLSCNLCGLFYAAQGGRVPKMLSCQHCYCKDCLDNELLWPAGPSGGAQWACGKCGVRTKVEPELLPEPEPIMYLIRNLRALKLGQVMMAMQEGHSRTTPLTVDVGAAATAHTSWLDDVGVSRFLSNSSEQCLTHGRPNTTWCHNCRHLMCIACSELAAHFQHQLTHHPNLRELVHQLLCNEMDKVKRAYKDADALAGHDMAMLRDLFDACHQLQNHVRREMVMHKPSTTSFHMREWWVRSDTLLNHLSREGALGAYELHQLLSRASVQVKLCRKQLLQMRFQSQLRAIIQENGMQVLTFQQLNDRLLDLQRCRSPPQDIAGAGAGAAGAVAPALMLTNYCIYTYWQQMQQEVMQRPQEQSPLLPMSSLWQMEPLKQAPAANLNFPHPAAQLFNNDYNRLNLGLLLGQNNAQAQPQSLGSSVVQQHGQGQGQGHGHSQATVGLVSIGRLPSVHCYPIYYMDMEIAGQLVGRVLIEVNTDAAPRMAENFGSLMRQDRGFGYRGCVVFQAWGTESIITGDFESQNGRGGHAAFEERFFMPDNTGLACNRGAVGMRRSQRRHDHYGLVGSQFRVLLNEHQTFTAIFGYIIDGIEMIDRIAATGNPLGRPGMRSIIKACGVYRPEGNKKRPDQSFAP
ncbi:uncharacterized protein LOC117898509 [Drosophila subobscura]|uniref:uncharacterized protein LOC117898509 n=1 Tax=Drosophila subobscura TaxID=7241 RepID=UPI00155A346A|nr:uncharacterized protein LOC117898509 [Drosophila subobscura]